MRKSSISFCAKKKRIRFAKTGNALRENGHAETKGMNNGRAHPFGHFLSDSIYIFRFDGKKSSRVHQ